MTADRSPEDWEASDHIYNLKKGVPDPGRKISGICDHHPSLACALIWIIRRMDRNDKASTFKVPVTSGGIAILIIGIFEAVKYLAS